MPMSKKNYIKFAEIFGRRKAKKETVDSTINYFKEDNPRFDETRFREAVKKNRDQLNKVM